MIKRFIGLLYYAFNKLITKNEYKKNLGLWFWNDGDNGLLLDHNIDKDSLVFDVGGYIGIFSDNIINKHDPYIYIFEPVPEYYSILEDKYKSNAKVSIFRFGLSDKNQKQFITHDGETSSVYKKNDKKIKIELIDINNIYKKLKPKNDIDLMSINIEGGEYELLNRIVDTGIINHVTTLQVQFHDFFPDASQKRIEIIQRIKQTHTVKYSYPFVWDCFERISK